MGNFVQAGHKTMSTKYWHMVDELVIPCDNYSHIENSLLKFPLGALLLIKRTENAKCL